MNSDRDTPPSSATLDRPPLPDEKPEFLYEVLEKEFAAIHGAALPLDEGYRRAQAEARSKAESDLAETIRERCVAVGKTITDEELRIEVEAEIYKNPALINNPTCRELFLRVHRCTESDDATFRHTALCLSGGGIRSATFALGVLQGLARKGVLKDFAYLSTVSGGGYVGSWLSSWIKRSGYNEALKALAAEEKPSDDPGRHQTQGEADLDPRQPFETEPRAIRHLREYSNYLTPVLGLFSGDSWTVAAIVARNLLLNWLVIVPAFLFVLLLPRLALRAEMASVGGNYYAGWAAAAAGFALGIYALAALFARYGKGQIGVLKHCVLPLAGAAACITLAWFWSRTANPEFGYFKSEFWRITFYMGWGAASVLIAAVVSRWLRHRQGLKSVGNFTIRLASIAAIFSLTGLLIWWVGTKAAEPLAEARKRETTVSGAAVPAKNEPVLGTLAPQWTTLSQQSGKASVTAWVLSENGKVSQSVLPDITEEAEAPGSYNHMRITVASLAVCFGFPLLLILIFLANTLVTGVLSRLMSDDDREWYARVSGWAFLLALLTCSVSLLVLRGPIWLVKLWDYAPTLVSSVAGGSALITILGGKSDRVAASHEQEAKHGLPEIITRYLVQFAAPIFVAVLVAGFSQLTTMAMQKILGQEISLQLARGDQLRGHSKLLADCGLRHLILSAVFLASLAWFGSRVVNINKFSLHAMYRNRLIRAYLGASNPQRAPNLFTGFDPDDNFEIASLGTQRPFHVINTTLNLVSGSSLAWQERLAESFTISPFACGSALLGYRASAEYAKGTQRGMTLGTALSISGAAISPNHGYSSSPLIAFILTFFNARLGGWFGNPGAAGLKTWKLASPDYALVPLVEEAFGLTNDENPFVYLSDGGHFENLGLYEMVLRRCRVIVVCDAGCDADYGFEDLGNAVAKIRVDLGIRIVFDPDIDIGKCDPNDMPGSSRTSPGHHCAVGSICYSDVDGQPSSPDKKRDGVLIYIKPAMTGTEPMDVFHYEREHREFPHEPTTDQWFSEAQFESYRMLGLHSIEQIFKAKVGTPGLTGLRAFREFAAAHVAPPVS